MEIKDALHAERLARSELGFPSRYGGVAASGLRAAEQEPSAAVRASSPEPNLSLVPVVPRIRTPYSGRPPE
eukprot:2292886-Prymnesium_polylepis.1